MKSYKGFNKDMTCRGKQYAEGETYEEKAASCCDYGMHACEYPLDVFGYYPPGQSVYHEAEQDGEQSRDGDDTKVASTVLKVGARLDIPGLVHAAIEYTKSRCTMENTDPKMATAGSSGAATAGDYGAATAGYKGAATAGYYGAATAGNYGAATAGYKGAATAGYKGAVTAGSSGAATAGDSGAATAGDYGAATSRGQSASGENGLSVARGNGVKVKGGMGAILVIAEEKQDSYDIENWKAVVVDGEKIKPDTWYKMVDGELVEDGGKENE
nr:MAG TPA: hypothetical protein [Caudoviricetes sp.]